MVIQTLFFDSRDNKNTINASGNSFVSYYRPPIFIPKQARNCYVSLVSASIVNNFDNVKTGINDKLYFKSYIAGVLSAEQSITLDNGMYSVTQLNNTVNRLIKDQTGIADAVNIEVEYASNYLYITLKNGWQIIFQGKTDTFRDLLGFTANNLVSTRDGHLFKMDTESAYQAASGVQIHSSFGKSNSNGRDSDILQSIPMVVSPGFTQNYQATILNLVDASSLAGTYLSDSYFTLTSIEGKELVVADNWSLTIRLQYDI